MVFGIGCLVCGVWYLVFRSSGCMFLIPGFGLQVAYFGFRHISDFGARKYPFLARGSILRIRSQMKCASVICLHLETTPPKYESTPKPTARSPREHPSKPQTRPKHTCRHEGTPPTPAQTTAPNPQTSNSDTRNLHLQTSNTGPRDNAACCCKRLGRLNPYVDHPRLTPHSSPPNP